MNQLESQIITEEAAKDLTTVNLLMQKQNVSKKDDFIMEQKYTCYGRFMNCCDSIGMKLL